MKTCLHTKLVQAGGYIAEVDVELTKGEDGWSPYLSVEEAEKLDAVKLALESGDLKAAGKLARVYRMTPVDV